MNLTTSELEYCQRLALAAIVSAILRKLRPGPITRLPVELLTEIAQNCPQLEKARLCLTNRRLHDVTTRELYRHISLFQPRTPSIEKLQALLTRVSDLCTTLSKSSVKRGFVEVLEIEGL